MPKLIWHDDVFPGSEINLIMTKDALKPADADVKKI